MVLRSRIHALRVRSKHCGRAGAETQKVGSVAMALRAGETFTGWRPPVPSGPLYSRKGSPRTQAPPIMVAGLGWFYPCLSRDLWERHLAAMEPNATNNPKRAWCMGCPFAGIKRTGGNRRPPSRKRTSQVPRPPATRPYLFPNTKLRKYSSQEIIARKLASYLA